MRRYIPLLLVGLCVLFVILAMLLYTTQIVGQKNQDEKFVPVTKTLTAYTTMPADMAMIIAEQYQKEDSVKINFVMMNSDELEQKMNSENDADLIIADSKLLEKIAQKGVLAGNISEQEDIVADKFKSPTNQWIGIWYDPIVFCYNLDYVKNNWYIPTSWEELAQSQQIKIAMTDCTVASASSNVLYSLIENKGDVHAFELLKNIHQKVTRYAKYLSTPVRMVGMAEADVAIAVQSETLRYIHDGYPLTIIYPEDGTTYQLTAVGIVSTSKQQNEANDFVKWLLGDNVQMELQHHQYYYVPTNYSSLTYKEFAGKNISFLEKYTILDSVNKKIFLDKWVKEIRLAN
ncbi:ABC transporter substrate-binding protein [Megamonas hypermegale]|uniref:ABC transporter substrate-binding protein n=1 Tax=Megamonas hypermegale TaxID=158847 RepID=UPI001958379D|nr:extracellular solute-binding protein [Megamonas hypermegale]MBM6832352.1 extracellular solute-binding protein [Megamonas hypermegale]